MRRRARTLVHPLAVVEAGASVGAATEVWHHAHVRAGAVIGAGCRIGKNVYIDAGVQIGDRVKIQNNACLYAGVVVEDGVFIGPGTIFTNDLYPRVRKDWTPVPTRVCRGASIGANATIIAGSGIGACALVGAGTVVTAPVAPHALVRGNPGRQAGWVCTCGSTVWSQDGAGQACPGCGFAPDEPAGSGQAGPAGHDGGERLRHVPAGVAVDVDHLRPRPQAG